MVMVLAATSAIGGLTGSSSLLGEREAHAVIGRPLTPMSYAGVARRTTRRAYRAGAYGAAAAAPAGVVTTLPAGCGSVTTGGAVVYDCAGSRYRPYYDGPTVVYRPL
ncbi:MAG TPA: hypothetical protein VGL61_03845 [Kofleriaceae bacterium]